MACHVVWFDAAARQPKYDRAPVRTQPAAPHRQASARPDGPSAEKRRCTQPVFQETDLLTDGTMGHAELGSRFLQTAETGGSFEGADRIQRRQTTSRDKIGHE